MFKFLKSSVGIILALIIGFGAVSLMNGIPNSLSSLEHTLSSWRASLGYALLGKKSPSDAGPKEGLPTPGVTMTPEEISEAQRHFNRLAGIEPKKADDANGNGEKPSEPTAEKESDSKKEKGDAPKDALEKVKIPTSLFPVKKKRKSLSGKTPSNKGAVYALGTTPYGPPPFVKSKIFTKNALLHLDHDPSAPKHALQEQGPYKKPNHPLPLLDRDVKNTTLQTFDAKNALTLQLGSFGSEKSAFKLKQKLGAKGYDVGIYKGGKGGQTWYYVRLNEIMTEEEALSRKEALMRDGTLLPLVVPIDAETKERL